MVKTVILSAALCVGASYGAMAQSYINAYNTQRVHKTIAANGRCNGVSFGTGERRCGSRTGGVPGGLPSRN